MLELRDNHICYKFDRCQQCGACYAVCPKSAIKIEPDSDGLNHFLIDDDLCVKCGKCISVCPSNRTFEDTDYLSRLKDSSFYLAYNTDNSIRRGSSSGGACKTLIIESLKMGLVDAVYSLRIQDVYPLAYGELFTLNNVPNYSDIPNSIYHSILACKELGKIKRVKRLMLVGTSCQLYALENALKGRYEELYKVCIFCKQQKTLKCTRVMYKLAGGREETIGISNLKVRYRGDGWPGIVKINETCLAWERAAAIPFGRRLWCVPGCDICGDPFGIEVKADLSLMDPWKIRGFNDLGETLACIYTHKGEAFFKSVNNLHREPKAYQEIKSALGEADVWRKQQLVPYFKGEVVEEKYKKAAEAEIKQRRQFEFLLDKLPRLPLIIYRVLNRVISCKRDKSLEYNL